ncbi:MAG: hypothetical protein ACI8TX_003867 [Hyphomicrobiaceae bacterium]
MSGQPGADRLEGGNGDDDMSAGAGNDQLFGDRGDDSLNGSTGNDLLDGGDGNDFLRGGPQHDQLFGRDGDDDLRGGGGNDELHGGNGQDILDGGSGRDVLDGGFDNDILEGEGGDDVLDGNGGIDTAVFRGRSIDHEVTVTEVGTIVRDLVRRADPEDPDAPKEFNDGTDILVGIERLQFTDRVTGPDGINGLPDPGPDVRIEVPRNSPGLQLSIEPPVDPDGDTFTLRIVETPAADAGTILRPDRSDPSTDVPVQLGERVELALLVRTTFVPENGFVGSAGAFSYEVDDGNGGKVVRRLEFEIVAPPPGLILLDTLSGSDGFVVEGAARDDEAGISLGAVDLDGDGHAEVLIGARNADPRGDASGQVYAIFGGEAPFERTVSLGALGSATGIVLDGEAAGDRAGVSVAGVGDSDGDGFADLAIGARGSDRGADDRGAAYLVYGSETPATRVRLDSLADGQGTVFESTLDAEILGARVAGAGDVNGDGFADTVIAAPGANTETRELAGHVYVAFGAGERFDSTTLAEPPKVLRIIGENRRDSIGTDVAGIGDIDGDGYDEIGIGAPFADPNGSRSGAAYVVFGGPDLDAVGTLDLDVPGEQRILVVKGAAEENETGTAVSGAGDINGDGFDDLLVGAPGADPIGTDTGEVYIVYGGPGIGDRGSLDVRSLDGLDGVVVRGVIPGDRLGTAVAGVGDTDGDGFDDILLGARDADPVGDGSGEAYLVFGAEVLGFDGAIDLFRMRPDEGLVASGLKAGDRTGIALSGLGDMDGDGLADFAIGASGADPGGLRSAGTAYVVLGQDLRGVVFSEGTSGDDLIGGTAADESFVAGSGADIIFPGGGRDVVYAGAGDDTVVVSDINFRRVDGGSGFDTLMVTRGLELDLTASPRSSVREIETFDMRGTNARLVIDPVAAAGLSAATNETVVLGAVGTTTQLVGTWVRGEAEIRGELTFRVFESGAVRLLVQDSMSVQDLELASVAATREPTPPQSVPALLATPVDVLLTGVLISALVIRGMKASVARVRVTLGGRHNFAP